MSPVYLFRKSRPSIALLLGTTAFFSLGFAAAQAQAQEVNWTGSDALNDNFNSVANWDTGAVPTAADNVIIDDVSISSPKIDGGVSGEANILIVGEDETDVEFEIQGNGTLDTVNTTIGQNAGSEATIFVRQNAEWNNAEDLFIGDEGTGSLIITAGGENNAPPVPGISPTVTVEGATTLGVLGAGRLAVRQEGTVFNTGDLFIGDGGTGEMEVSDGAVVNSGGDEFDVIGGLNGSTGTALVTGPGSQWNNNATPTLIGEDGTGTLTISDGGEVRHLVSVVGAFTGSGSVTVTGADSLWRNEIGMVIGSQGEGSLTISDNGLVQIGTGGADGLRTVIVASEVGSTGTIIIGGEGVAAAAGTLDVDKVQFGDINPAIGDGDGSVGDGSFIFNHTNAGFEFAPQIVGQGEIVHNAGETILTGDSSLFTGNTTLQDGTLIVNGELGGLLTGNGGVLGGVGTLVTVNLGNGATIAPGNSVGTLNVTDITFGAGSIYEVEVNDGGNVAGVNNDLIDASGTATIDADASVNVVAENVTDDGSTYAANTTYTILNADGGRTGEFGTLTENFAFLDGALTYDANNVFLTLTQNDVGFASVGQTSNQKATAGTLEGLGAGATLFDAVLPLSEAQALLAFDGLSGEIHASAKTVLIDDSRFVRDTASNRIRDAFEGVASAAVPVLAYGPDGANVVPANTDGLAFWSSAFGSWGNWDGDGNAARLDRSTGGLFLGADASVSEGVRLGLFGGYSRTGFEVDDRASSGSADNYHLGAFGGVELDDLILSFGGAYSWHNVSTSRSVAFTGFTDTLSADYNAYTAQIFGEAAYRIDLGGASFEPFANLAYVNLSTNGFTETGGAAALTAASSVVDATFTTLGARAETDISFGETQARLHGALGWRHAFGDVTPTATHAFASGGNNFTVAGVPIARDAAVIEAGLDLALTSNMSIDFSYSGQIASGFADHGLKASLSARF